MRLLDLFCGAGGAAMGYHRAGFEVVGVDIEPQPDYPFEFHRADAMAFPLRGFDVIHASPPCQAYSSATRHLHTGGYPKLVGEVQARLEASGVRWVIENVTGSPIPVATTLWGDHGLMLCGTMFGLRVRRHRRFWCSHPVTPPSGCNHDIPTLNPYRTESRIRDGLRAGSMKAYGAAMGVDWCPDKKITLAIPPVYTEHIGRQLTGQ